MVTESTSRWGVALAVFALVGVAGCDMAPAGGPAAAPPAAGTVDPCAVVPPAVVNTVLGIDAPGSPELGDDAVSCRWENTATRASMELEIGAPGSAAGGSVPPADAAEPIPGGDGIEADGSSNLRFAVRDRLCSLRIDAGNIDRGMALRLAQAIRAAVAAGLPAAGGLPVPPDNGGPVPAPSQAGSLAGKAVYYGGFKVTFGDVSQAPGGPVVVPATFENTGTSGQLPLNNGSNYREVALASGGKNYRLAGDLPQVPSGSTADGRLEFAVDQSFTMNDAVLTIGSADTEQVVVPLGGTGQLVTLEPTPFTVTGRVQAGQLSITAKSGELRAGLPVANRQAPRGQRYLHLVVDALWADPGGGNLDTSNFAVTTPNGTRSSVEITEQFTSVILKGQSPTRDLDLWFIVDAPGTGEYTLLVNSRGVESPLPFTVS